MTKTVTTAAARKKKKQTVRRNCSSCVNELWRIRLVMDEVQRGRG